jgi:hypothetical protein
MIPFFRMMSYCANALLNNKRKESIKPKRMES